MVFLTFHSQSSRKEKQKTKNNDYTHCYFWLLILLSLSLPSSIPEAMTRKVHKPELSEASSVSFFSVSFFFFLYPLSKAHSSTFPFGDRLHHVVVNLHHQQDKILNHRGNRFWVVSSTKVFLLPGRLNWEEEIYPEGRQHHPMGWGLKTQSADIHFSLCLDCKLDVTVSLRLLPPCLFCHAGLSPHTVSQNH